MSKTNTSYVCTPPNTTSFREPRSFPSLSPQLHAQNLLHLRQYGLVRHGLPVLLLLDHLGPLVDLLGQVRLAHLLLQLRLLYRLPHIRQDPVQRRRLTRLVQLLVGIGICLPDRLHQSPCTAWSCTHFYCALLSPQTSSFRIQQTPATETLGTHALEGKIQ
jgi:hypothetical protein